jgi:hypothetical protein
VVVLLTAVETVVVVVADTLLALFGIVIDVWAALLVNGIDE